MAPNGQPEYVDGERRFKQPMKPMTRPHFDGEEPFGRLERHSNNYRRMGDNGEDSHDQSAPMKTFGDSE
jgi:hypothetical protein